MRCAATIDMPLKKPKIANAKAMKSVVAAVAPASATAPKTANCDGIYDAQQLIAKHLQRKRKRKAPERGANLGMVDDHRRRSPQAVQFRERTRRFRRRSCRSAGSRGCRNRAIVHKHASRDELPAGDFGTVEIEADPSGAPLRIERRVDRKARSCASSTMRCVRRILCARICGNADLGESLRAPGRQRRSPESSACRDRTDTWTPRRRWARLRMQMAVRAPSIPSCAGRSCGASDGST